jgi:ABC-type antimicrobial peptide transport system permease subunit
VGFAAILAVLVPIIIISICITVLEIVALWFVFEKAGEPGWAAIIPIYNALIVIKIAGKPWWWILLALIPLVNLIFYILVLDGLSKNFGKTSAFTVGLFFLRFIFLPILGFGKSQYSGDKSKFCA